MIMDPQVERPAGENKSIPLSPILLVNFIGTLGFSIILPFLVFLVTRFGGNALIYGLIGATYPAFQLFGAPILGKWSDLYGRKKILLLSQIGTLFSWIIFLLAFFVPLSTIYAINSASLGIIVITVPLLIFFISRAMDGLTGGNVSVANAYLADITQEQNRKANFGKMAASTNLGFIIGPALAGVLGATIYGELIPVTAALLISLAAVFIIAYRLPESRFSVQEKYPEKVNVRKVFGQEQKECYRVKEKEKITIRDILEIRNVPYILVLYFMIFLGFNIFYTAFPIHAVQHLNWSVTQMGIFFAFLSLVMVFVQGPVLEWIGTKYSSGLLILVGSIILGTNFILIMSGNLIIIYIAGVFFAVGNGLMWPSFLSILSIVAGDKYQGSVQGFASSSGSLASIIGLVGGGILYGLIGSGAFLVSAVIIFVVFFMSIRLLSFREMTA